MNNTGHSHYTISNDGAFKINVTSSSPTPYTTGLNAMTIGDNGYVGIGTTSPTSTLDVVGSANFTSSPFNVSSTSCNICTANSFTGTVNIGTGTGTGITGSYASYVPGYVNIGSNSGVNVSICQNTLQVFDSTIDGAGMETWINGQYGRLASIIQTSITSPTLYVSSSATNLSGTTTTISGTNCNITSPATNLSGSVTTLSSPTCNITSPATNLSGSVTTLSSPTINITGTATNISSPTLYVSSANITLGTTGTTNTNLTGTVHLTGNLTVTGTATATSFTSTSDYRAKKEISPLLLEEYSIDKLNPVKFKYINTNEDSIGLIAHEIQEHYPFLVEGEKDGEKMQSVNYMGLIGVLIKEVQELKNEIKREKEYIKLKPSKRPENGEEGTLYYDKDRQILYYKDGIGWVEMGYENF